MNKYLVIYLLAHTVLSGNKTSLSQQLATYLLILPG